MENIPFNVHFTRLLDEGIPGYVFEVEDPEDTPKLLIREDDEAGSALWAVGPVTLHVPADELAFDNVMLLVTVLEEKRKTRFTLWAINAQGEFVRGMEA